ncbi:MAG: adenosylcobinamide-GDP ribazoletransferase [Firmicutes bacterium]|nr:adenosylcobinamide-GDP ribazoletransferase [Bacillota bacterium]
MRTFLLSLQFLTRLPVSIRGQVTPPDMVGSAVFFPLVGSVIGLALAGLDIALSHLYARPLVVVLDLSFLALLTGGLHLDGLMDSADGLFSGRSRERALEIMKDSRVGAMGVLTVLLVLFLQSAALLVVPEGNRLGLLLLFPLAGRLSLVLVAARFPPAKATGLGNLLAGRVGRSLWLPALLYSLLVTYSVAILRPGWMGGILALLGSQILGLALAHWAARRLGGITGDIFGAVEVLTELAFMLIWVAL